MDVLDVIGNKAKVIDFVDFMFKVPYIRAKAKANFSLILSLLNANKCKYQIGFSVNPFEVTSLSLSLLYK